MINQKTKKKDGKFAELFMEGKSHCVGIVNRDGTIFYQKYFKAEQDAVNHFVEIKKQFEEV